MHLQSSFFEEILGKVPAEIVVASKDYRYIYVNACAVPDQQLRAWMIGKTNEEFCNHAGRSLEISRTRRQVFNTVLTTRKVVEWTESARDEEGALEHFMHRIIPIF